MRALITGITGMDGHYLAEHLLGLGYEVYGVIRGQDNPRRAVVERELPGVRLVQGDLLDQVSLRRALEISTPDEVYNLGGVTFVPISWEQPTLTAEVTGLGILRLLDAIRSWTGGGPTPRVYQASSSEQFGRVRESPQSERTPFHPRSPYGCAKVFAHSVAVNYRESYGMHVSCGILFNHESPRRPPAFVTRKVTRAAARIALGLEDELVMGNLDARRDWGFAGDYVKAMHLMLQQPEADDYVIGTGATHSVGDLVALAFGILGLDWREYVRQDPAFMRPAEVDLLLADPSKAKRVLGWEPEVDFATLIEMMIEHDMRTERGR